MKKIAIGFIGVCLLTEFFYIHIGGGILRPYHLFAIVLLFFLLIQKQTIFVSNSLILFLFFLFACVISCFLSSSASNAFVSLLSLFINVIVALVVYLLLDREKIAYEKFYSIFFTFTLITIVWGMLQYLLFTATGSVLALSAEQKPQILIHMIPSFRTESNTYGKFCAVALTICIPYLIRKRSKKLMLIAILLIAMTGLNFTRTAVFGFAICISFMILYYVLKGKGHIFAKYIIAVGIVGAWGLVLIFSGLINIGEYGLYKIQSFINPSILFNDVSGTYRLDSMKLVIQGSFESLRTVLWGKGWGQTYYMLQGRLVQSGGGDILNVYGYAGIIGCICYVSFTLKLISVCIKVLNMKISLSFRMFVESTLFSCITMTGIGMLSGMLITPEYWIMVATIFYIDAVYMRNKYTENSVCDIQRVQI